MNWRRFFRRRRGDQELALEIESYLEHAADGQSGLPLDEARLAARKKLGNPTLIREEVYRRRSLGWIEILWQDVRYATRMLRKTPGFTAVAVLSLAMGIGVNTAMFSVVNAVLLRSLPYPRPAQLVEVGEAGGDAATILEFEFSKEHSRTFSSITGFRGGGERRLNLGSSQEWIRTMVVTSDFLRTLDVVPALGREFNSEETHAGGPQAIILSDSIWRRNFGADPQILGRTIALDTDAFRVVGVLPPSFWFSQSADVLLALRPGGGLDDSGSNTQLIARLKDGVSIRQAQAEMTAVNASFERAHPATGSGKRDYRGLTVASYQDSLVGDVRQNLVLLFGATALLLLIACANLATLLLTRFASRSKELAVRLALGSNRARLLGQFLIENLLLAALGAGVGLVVAYSLLAGLPAWMPFNLPASGPIRLDATVLLFTLGVALATALAFSLLPLLTAKRPNLVDALKSGRASGTSNVRAVARNVLVIGEVALSTTLLIAAGLLIQSLYRLHEQQLGFEPRGLITFQTPFAPERRQNPADRANFIRTMLEQLSTIPGIQGIASADVLPLAGWSNMPTQRDGHPDQSIGGMEIRAVTPDYFKLMGIPVRNGRTFAGQDAETSPPVAAVNETLARVWWPQTNAIGDRVVIGRFRGRDFGKPVPREVIGIVGDTKTVRLKEPPRPTIYIPMNQADGTSSLAWIVRTDGSAGVPEQLRRSIAAIDPSQRVRQLRSMDDLISSTTLTPRFNASLFASFAGVAVALAAIGVYGLLSFLVSQRRQEIGTRIALGASRGNVLKLFLTQGLVLTIVGLAIGLGGALAVTKWLTSLLFGVRPNDPLSFVAVSAMLVLVGLTATWFPARRATKIDPMVALRYE